MEEVSALAAGGAAMLEEAAGMARAAAAAIFCARVCLLLSTLGTGVLLRFFVGDMVIAVR